MPGRAGHCSLQRMAFRFSRRVSILPGLKLNLSGGGVSLSAGVRGAHINVGSRGAFASAGISGTGISYRQRVSGGQSGRSASSSGPFSPRRWEATLRRIDREKAAGEAVKQLEEEWEAYQQTINFWRPLPQIPTFEDFILAQSRRPFEPEPPPLGPSWPEEQAACLARLTESVKSQWEYRVLPGFLASIEAKKMFSSVWPMEEARIQASHDEARAEHEQRMEESRSAWDSSEVARVAWLTRLTSGDLEEIKNTLTEIFSGLSLPSQETTECAFFFNAADSVSISLVLPGMEAVIASVRKRLLKNGTVKESARSRLESNQDYFNLVTGECAFVAAEVFSYLPLCQTIRMAAHTKRAKVRESDMIDTYLLDAVYSRDGLRGFDAEKTSMQTLLIDSGSRFDLGADYKLKRIAPPSWLAVEDLQGAGGDQSPDADAS